MFSCPKCSKESKVVDSREIDAKEYVRRRRECLFCKTRFSTIEMVHDFSTDGTVLPIYSGKPEQLFRQLFSEYLKTLSAPEQNALLDEIV